MGNLIYPGGSGITTFTKTNLNNDDATFVGCTIAGAAGEADYSVIKDAILSAPSTIGDDTPATSIDTNGITYIDNFENNGGLELDTVSASSGTLTGATDTIEVNIPANSKIVACQLRVDVAVVDDAGDDTWSAAYSGGSTQAISSGSAAAKNTKVNTFFDENAATAITASETDITLTPNGGNFTAGEITAVVYYYKMTSLSSV